MPEDRCWLGDDVFVAVCIFVNETKMMDEHVIFIIHIKKWRL